MTPPAAVTIDTASEPGSWAETLASASCGIKVVEGLHPLVRFYCQRNGIPLDHEAARDAIDAQLAKLMPQGVRA